MEKYHLTAGDLNIYHARLIADQQITCILEFSQSLDLNKLNNALTILYETLPILSYRVSVNGKHFQRVSAEHFQPIINKIIEPENRSREIAVFIGTLCNPEIDPPLKLLLIREIHEDILCIKIDHILADGGGLRVLVSLLSEVYAQGQIIKGINYNRGIGQILFRFSPLTLLLAFRNAKLRIPGVTFMKGSVGDGEMFIEHVVLEPLQFEKMKKASKRLDSTINNLLLTGLYRAIFSYLPENSPAYPVMVPVDMRRYLPSNRQNAIANLSAAIYPAIDPKPGESFEHTHLRVKNCIDNYKRHHPGLGIMLLMTIGSMNGGKMLFERYKKAAMHGSRLINMTNCGILDPVCGHFGNEKVKNAYFVGPIQFGPGIVITITTFADRLHLIVQTKGNHEYKRFVQDFMHTILSSVTFGLLSN